jgi:hypothetical protein
MPSDILPRTRRAFPPTDRSSIAGVVPLLVLDSPITSSPSLARILCSAPPFPPGIPGLRTHLGLYYPRTSY